ncbi:type I-F CRISPR-associated endoribonuclease Cas6/Csy4 [Candidatus Marinamargulisbacteria bacterium SCGC AAA071-K20]|nr:type I-F CRISPR-associated endoribonuclease Cas6/Csy4 [Candidatus Marinamargulisbacteria bacterium SCGC AAA071-K20]
MNFFINIELKPDSEMPVNRLLNNVYTKLHETLCDVNSTSIGISFPRYKVLFGNMLRIHGSEGDLSQLQKMSWLGGISGYCDISGITAVPDGVQFRTISRKQTTMSQAKLNRLLKRGTISADDVKVYKAKMFTKGLDNPYVELVSRSNGHKHRRYIEFGELLNNPVNGEFDQFGLSKTATVPWF